MVSYVVLGGPPAHMQWAGPVFMALAAGLCLIYSTGRYRVALALAGIVGFATEVLGVWTGFPFGAYEYTHAFAPLLIEVPLVMICAWAVLAGYLDGLLRPFVKHPLARALAGALGLTAIDLVLDPVAAGPMNLWEWAHEGRYYGIPLTNFVGWFVVGLAVFAVLLALGRREPVSPKLRMIGLSMVLFFTAIAFGQRLLLAGCWGLGLCFLHAYLARKARRREETSPKSPGEPAGAEQV
jgi:putative membrane protein